MAERSLTEIQRALKIARRNRQDVEYAYMHLLLDVAEAAHRYFYSMTDENYAALGESLRALSPDQEKDASGA